MDRPTFLECWKCKEFLQIGEANYLYTGEPNVRQNLNLFLQRHRDHALVFSEPTRLKYKEGWVNFEVLDYPTKLTKMH